MIQLMHHQNPFCVSFLLSTAFLVTQATSIYLCDSPTTDKVQSCLDEVENAESKLPAGPCKSSDWECMYVWQSEDEILSSNRHLHKTTGNDQ